MSRIVLLLNLSLFCLTLFFAPEAKATKLKCPPFNATAPKNVSEIKGLLPDSKAMADVGRLNAAIDTLRREVVPKSQIIRLLVGAYCPMVARESSSDAEKAASVRQFSGQITQLVYSLESGLDVIINVPFTPDVVDAINARARQQGLSGPAWIAMTVENALQLSR